MKKRLLSLTLIAALCLSLLPAPALASAVAPNVLWVGGTNVVDGGYWTTNEDGSLTKSDENNYNVYYDGNGNLWLNDANIVGQGTGNSATGIYAYYDEWIDTDIALTIHLAGNNSVANGYPIHVHPWGGNASLTITGPGSLTATGTVRANGGIFVQGDTSSLTIKEGADVTVKCARSSAVTIVADAAGTGTLTVDNAMLQADGYVIDDPDDPYGICFSYTGIPTDIVEGSRILNVSGNSIVDTNYMQATYTNLVIDASEDSGGIVFEGTEGTVYGDVTLQEDLTIGEGERLDIPSGASLTVPSEKTLTNNGALNVGDTTGSGGTLTIAEGGTLTNNHTVTNNNGTITNNGTINNSGTLPEDIGGTVNHAPSITTGATLPAGTVGTTYSQTLVASGTETISWELASGSSLPTGLSLSGNTIAGTPTASGTFTFTVTASNVAGSDSQEFSLTINAAAPTITTQPQAQTVTEGGTATFTVAASGSGTLTYQWQQSTDGGNSWADIPNATGASYTITGATAEMSGTQYHCVVKGDGGETTSSAATLTVRSYEPPYTGKYSYEIVSNVGENGTIDVDRYATEGDQVTITVSPDEAYLLDDLTVTSGGKDVALTDNGDGTYTFTMPSGDVAITATFAEDPNWEEPEDPATDVSEIFTDVPANHWAQAAIQYVYDNGLMTGVSDSAFAPEATTTRAMIVSMLARMENVTSAADAGFADVAADDWYATAVNWAAANGIASGISDDTFAPNDPITREQLAAMLMNVAQWKGQDTSARADLSDYTDAPSTWASEAVQWAVAEGLLAGVTDDQLQPQGQATRAQVAAILERFLEA